MNIFRPANMQRPCSGWSILTVTASWPSRSSSGWVTGWSDYNNCQEGAVICSVLVTLFLIAGVSPGRNSALQAGQDYWHLSAAHRVSVQLLLNILYCVNNVLNSEDYAVASHYYKKLFCENSDVRGFLWSSWPLHNFFKWHVFRSIPPLTHHEFGKW